MPDLSYEHIKAALEMMSANDVIPPRDSNEALMERIIFAHGDTIAILKAYGYVFCVDEGFMIHYKSLNPCLLSSSISMKEYTDSQLREQGVL